MPVWHNWQDLKRACAEDPQAVIGSILEAKVGQGILCCFKERYSHCLERCFLLLSVRYKLELQQVLVCSCSIDGTPADKENCR